MRKVTLSLDWQRLYVAILLDVVSRGLVAASKVDLAIQQEIKAFPVGLEIAMNVLPTGSSFRIGVNNKGYFELIKNPQQKADLTISWKHISHAFLTLSFQESTARSFANDRIIADGEITYAVRMVRCLDRLEALILPRFIAELAIKRYPNRLSHREKISKASQIYALSAASLLFWR